MEMTSDRRSLTLDFRDRFLSFQMIFSLARAACACAILERTSFLEPSSVMIEPKYLNLSTVSGVVSFSYFFAEAICVMVCHYFSFFRTYEHSVGARALIQSVDEFPKSC